MIDNLLLNIIQFNLVLNAKIKGIYYLMTLSESNVDSSFVIYHFNRYFFIIIYF